MLAAILLSLFVSVTSLVKAEPAPAAITSPAPDPTTSSHYYVQPSKNGGFFIRIPGTLGNGSPLQLSQRGVAFLSFARGGGHISVENTNLCLDAGENPTSGSNVHLWQCYGGLPQQEWYWTYDNRFALTGTGLCLDIPSGQMFEGQVLQVWSCQDNNENQAWSVGTSIF